MHSVIAKLQTNLNSPQMLSWQKNNSTCSYQEFWHKVWCLSEYMTTESQLEYYLWEEQGSDFLICFLGLLLAHKTVYLPANKLLKTFQNFEQQGVKACNVSDYSALIQSTPVINAKINQTDKLDWQQLLRQPFFLQTSGSTGAPKNIVRNLGQIFKEALTISAFAKLTENDLMLTTVSHQHLFGLTYQLLLPLINGAAFYSETLLFSETLLAKALVCRSLSKNPVVISSQAFLTRLSSNLDFPLKLIFTAGGPVTEQVRHQFQGQLIEIYGSTETGGIAFSKQNSVYQPFAQVEIKSDALNQILVRSPYAFTEDWYNTNDVLEWVGTSEFFKIKGRTDRLIKLQEKRISLIEIEQILMTLPEIKQVYLLTEMTEQQREVICAACELQDSAWQLLKKINKNHFINLLKQQLKDRIEIGIIPKKWRFLNSIPKNNLNKIDFQQLQNLFKTPLKIPKYDVIEHQPREIEIALFFNAELCYFQGHFPQQAIFPGVAQLAVVLYFAQLFFGVNMPLNALKRIKYAKIIQPYDQIVLNLNFNQTQQLNFKMSDSNAKLISSGTLCLKVDVNE